MWIVLTRADANVPVHVNMELVTWMWRIPNATETTEIVFGKDFALLVKETPDEIQDRLMSFLTSEEDPNG
jgi:hypothetical protein